MNFIFLHKIANRMFRKCQAILGISIIGARAIVLNSENQILLVKHTYEPYWYIPGGGVKKGEPVKTALLRELKEEVGVSVVGEPELFGIYYHTYFGVHDYPVIYIVKKYTREECSSPEIAETGWFSYENLPEMTSPGTRKRLNEYFKKIPPTERW